MNTADILKVERLQPGLALMTLNRPDQMNALSLPLRRALIDGFDQLDEAGDVSVVVLTGAGKGFCAGLDLKEMSEDSTTLTSVASLSPIAAIRRFSGIVIGAVNGAAVTGGFELALACDLLIASAAARFADTHLKVGAMPGWELSQRLSRTVGTYRAKQMTLTGQYISAEQAERWGIVSEVLAPDDLLPRALTLAQAMLSMPADGLRQHKRLIDDGYAVTLAEGLRIEAESALAHNSAVAPESVASRRADIQRHGRNRP
jgi:enoyl-CoA hydratase